jgi:hypothetical protein
MQSIVLYGSEVWHFKRKTKLLAVLMDFGDDQQKVKGRQNPNVGIC